MFIYYIFKTFNVSILSFIELVNLKNIMNFNGLFLVRLHPTSIPIHEVFVSGLYYGLEFYIFKLNCINLSFTYMQYNKSCHVLLYF